MWGVVQDSPQKPERNLPLKEGQSITKMFLILMTVDL